MGGTTDGVNSYGSPITTSDYSFGVTENASGVAETDQGLSFLKTDTVTNPLSYLGVKSYDSTNFIKSSLERNFVQARQAEPETVQAQAVSLNSASETRLAKVNPELAKRIRAVAADLEKQGIKIMVTSGLRTFAEQTALYAQGRQSLSSVNALRKQAGMPPISASENRYTVTNAKAGSSFHNYGLAVDVVPLNSNGQPNWSASNDIWNKIGAAGKKYGLTWGGNWTSIVDKPHLQLDGGKSSPTSYRAIYDKGGLQAVWDEVNKHTPPIGNLPGNPPASTGIKITGLPNYNQTAAPWGSEPYKLNPKLGNFANNGCTSTAAAIAASWASGKTVTPHDANQNWGATISKFEYQNLGPGGKVPFGNIFSPIGKTSEQAKTMLDKVKASIKSGHPVVIGLSGGIKTTNGHHYSRHTVIAVGIDKNGGILVNDPATGKTQLLSNIQFNNFDMAQKISKIGGGGGTVEGTTPTNPTNPTNPTTNLKLGSRGATVTQLQKDLNSIGFKLATDGIFGAKTDAAVRSFQKSKNLVADGIVGPKTRAAIEAAKKSNNPTPTQPSLPVPTAVLRKGSSGTQVKQLQDALVKLGFMTQAQMNTGPGTFGPRTESALKAFQHSKGLVADGIYGPKTRAALTKALGGTTAPPKPPTPPNPPTPPSGNIDLNGIQNVKGNPNVTPAFINEVKAMAGRLGTKPEYLMAVMSFESGLSPKAVNPLSGATGLIQFMPSTARGLGTTTSALKNMTALQQLKYVEKYFQPFKGKLNTLEGAYTAVLSGSPHPNSNDVLFSSGAAYDQNKGLDFNGDHKITSGEATSAVACRLFGGVSKVQQRLKDLGFDPKGVDGRFGKNTSAAIADFQRARRLPATGLLDEATGKALFK